MTGTSCLADQKNSDQHKQGENETHRASSGERKNQRHSHDGDREEEEQLLPDPVAEAMRREFFKRRLLTPHPLSNSRAGRESSLNPNGVFSAGEGVWWKASSREPEG